MFNKILAFFKEVCPYCKRSLVSESKAFSVAKMCPEGHYCIESHTILGVQVEYHSKK